MQIKNFVLALTIAIFNLLTQPIIADSLDYGHCYCGGHWKWPRMVEVPPSKPGDPEPKVNYGLSYINYRSMVHKRNFTAFMPIGPVHEYPMFSAWIRLMARDRIRKWEACELNYTWPDVADEEPVYFEKIQSEYRFNKGNRKLLPGKSDHRYDRIIDCTNWCRGVFPNEPDIISICNQSAPGFLTMKKQLRWENVFLPGYNNGGMHWEWPEEDLECFLHHYKGMDDDP